jgi:hypothetical protein
MKEILTVTVCADGDVLYTKLRALSMTFLFLIVPCFVTPITLISEEKEVKPLNE